jgi:hypothetical protein
MASNKGKKEKNTKKVQNTTQPVGAKVLKAIWENISHPASFSSPRKLWKAAVKQLPKLKLDEVVYWLSTQPSYSLFRKAVTKFKRKRVVTSGLNDQLQADLMDMHHIAKENKGYKYILAAIDCFSRFAYLEALKDKTAESTAIAFKRILSRSGKIRKLQTDQGGEFLGQAFQRLITDSGISHFVTDQDVKAQMVERFNRTFKEKMTRYFFNEGKLEYLSVLQTMVKTYNSTPHSSLGGIAPDQVNEANERIIHKMQYYSVREPKYRFEINDKVRITAYRKTFHRVQDKNFTTEIFFICDKYNTVPPSYTVKDAKGEILKGIVYQEEMVKVN